MRLSRYCLFLVAGFLVPTFAVSAYAQVVPDSLTLIAHWPLENDALDIVGNNEPLELTNAPFQEGGGVLLNGIYIGTSENGSLVKSGSVEGLNFDAFAIQATFKVEAYSEYSRPVIQGGRSWRWMGFYLEPDSVLGLDFGALEPLKGTAEYQLNTWHVGTMVYDAASRTGKVFLDTTEAVSYQWDLEHGDDRTFSTDHGGRSDTYKGMIKDIKVYTWIPPATATEERPHASGIDDLRLESYPNPIRQSGVLSVHLDRTRHVAIQVFTMLGQRVDVVFDGTLAGGLNDIVLDVASLPEGHYLCRATTRDGDRSHMFTVVR